MVLTAPPPPPLEALDQGVIEEARRRQRRRRIAVCAATFVVALAGLGVFLLAGAGSTPVRALPRLRPAEPLPRLAGPALGGATRLRIVAEGNGGPPSILDVERGTVRTVHGLGVPPVVTLWGPRVGLTPAPGGVLAVVDRQDCPRCARSQTEFLIGAGGAVRRLATQPLAAGSVETAPAHGSTAVLVLTWPHGHPCTVGLVPGGRSAVRVPCGDLVGDSAAGISLSTGHGETIVDPLTGRIRYVAAPHDLISPLNRELAFEVAFQQWDAVTGGHYGKLSLVNLISGRRRRLAWPSYFGDIIRVVPEPHGPLVAVDFGSPAYPGPAQAEDIWMLDTTTGSFTHLPAYPAQVDIKFSSVAWTGDDRLVIVAQGGGRTVVGVWRPGAAALPLRTVPSRSSGYSSSVPLVG